MMSPSETPLDLDVFDRYSGLQLPRHVSYPMPTWWSDADEDLAEEVRRRRALRPPGRGLSLYVHVPFCESPCKYCACSRVVLPRSRSDAAERVEAYVAALETEIRSLGRLYGEGDPLRQVHWGGGTPTYLDESRLERLAEATRESFRLAADVEMSVEVDPRVTTDAQLALMRSLGFGRVSLGVQDFDPTVQRHVSRPQPYGMVEDMLARCRDLGYGSVNFDLIYGLPYQTLESNLETLDKVVALSPDRVAYYHYAQIPEKIASQVAIRHDRAPGSRTKLVMFLDAVRLLRDAGYRFIGLDHFAKPDEALAEALRNGTLQRTFQGMTTGGGLDVLGAGASSISHARDVGFLQNVRAPREYVETVERGESAIPAASCSARTTASGRQSFRRSTARRASSRL
jgi:oxygen-independent coproporphyrinogen-3 oxidase